MLSDVRGSKRKERNFKDEEYYISSVPKNHVNMLVGCPVSTVAFMHVSLSWQLTFQLVLWHIFQHSEAGLSVRGNEGGGSNR